MKIQKVQCLIRVLQGGSVGSLVVPRSGPDAVPVTEIPILRMSNDIDGGGDEDCCISKAMVVGDYEASTKSEFDRLCSKYGAKRVNAVYPGRRGMPKSIEDCELPDTAIAKEKPKEKPVKEPVA